MKEITCDNVRFTFSAKSYKAMLSAAVRYDLDIDFWLYVDYCDAFEVL